MRDLRELKPTQWMDDYPIGVKRKVAPAARVTEKPAARATTAKKEIAVKRYVPAPAMTKTKLAKVEGARRSALDYSKYGRKVCYAAFDREGAVCVTPYLLPGCFSKYINGVEDKGFAARVQFIKINNQ